MTLLTALLVIVGDQAGKALVRSQLRLGQSVPVIPGIFDLTHVRNTGGAFGLFPNYQWLFIAVAVIVIIVMIFYFHTNRPKEYMVRIGLGLAAGGALGNLVDRLIYGRVTDFLDFHFWPVFNLADTAIVIGMVMITFSYLSQSSKPEKQSDNNYGR